MVGARIVDRGKLDGKFAEAVREGQCDVMVGVVGKGQRDGKVWMAKIRTNRYMDQLKKAFQVYKENSGNKIDRFDAAVERMLVIPGG